MHGSVNRRTVALAGLACLTAACGDGREAPRSTDSGIPAVVTLIDLESDENAELGHVQDGLVLADGTVVLLAAGPPFLHRFSPDGTRLLSGVRKGAGPGELWFPRQALRCGGDSVFVWEMSRRQVAVYDAAFDHVRSFTVPGSPIRLACNLDGQMVTLDLPRQEAMAELDLAGSDRFVRVPTRLHRTNTRGDSLPGSLVVPFAAPHPLSATTRAALTGSGVMISTAESLAIGHYDLELRPRGDVVLGSWRARPATAAEYEAAVDEELAVLPPAMRDQVKPSFMTGPLPPTAPPYYDVVMSPEGRLYLLTSSPADSVATVLVTTLTGHPVRSVTLPVRGRLLDAIGDLLLVATGPSEEHARVVVVRVAAP